MAWDDIPGRSRASILTFLSRNTNRTWTASDNMGGMHAALDGLRNNQSVSNSVRTRASSLFSIVDGNSE